LVELIWKKFQCQL